jgi:gamma-glutamyltranspeptidase/glutathione hydrolase
MQTTRAVVHSKNGGVAASQPLAVSAALNILQRGGSCIDAGIAASAVLNVVEPSCSHLGGDAFLVVHNAKTRKNIAFNGSGEAPHDATAAEFAAGISAHGFRAGTVPGLVSTWFEAHKSLGRLPMSELLQPAIEYAKNGFPANADFVKRIQTFLKAFQ